MELNEIVNIVSGYAFPSSDMQAEGVPILKITNILENGELDLENTIKYSKPIPEKLRKFLLRDKDVLVCMTGATIGKVARKQKVKQDFLINQRVAIIRAKEKLLEDFVYYLLSLPAFRKYVEIVGYGAAQPNISAKSIGKFRFLSVGNFYKCQSIGTILSAYDSLIENNTKRIRLLEKMAENLYKEWFVRFRFPGYEKAEMENGLPKGWKIKRYEDELNVKYGKGLPTDRLTDKGYPVFGSNGQIGYYTSYMYEQPQILISCRGASSGVVNISLPMSFVTNNSLVCEIGDKTESVFEYLKYYFLNTNLVQYQTGSAQPQITINNIVKLKMLVPLKEVQNKFAAKVMVFDKEMQNLAKQNSLLARRRDLLLPRLMSGKLEVKP